MMLLAISIAVVFLMAAFAILITGSRRASTRRLWPPNGWTAFPWKITRLCAACWTKATSSF